MPNGYNPYLEGLLRENDLEGLQDALRSYSPFEIADIITHKPEEQQTLLFHALTPAQKHDTIDFFPVWLQKKLLGSLPAAEAADLLCSLSPDDRTSYLQELPRETVDELIKQLPYDERVLTLALLGYPENSIGRLMTPDYIAVGIDWSVEEILDHLQHYGQHCETMDYIYVVDDDLGTLLGVIKLTDLLLVPRNSKAAPIVNFKFPKLTPDAKDETAINVFKANSRIALPVVDEKGTMLGIVTIDDILRLSNEEATEDIQRLGGMEALDEPYMQAPFLDLMKKRAGWLVILFLGELLTATAMSYFEDELAKAVVLALFLPLIISSGGNAGSQATTLVIRALALGEVKLKDWWKIVRLEISSGLFLGTVLGILGFLRIALWSQVSNMYGEHWFLLSLTVGFSLIGVVLWGTLSGAVFPLLLKRVGVDPAAASAPFVATVVDVTGLIIYFLIAIVILSGTLL